ncbi:MAG TPA: SCP2 sterol-binding domain-containing protein [Burkholderiaceae bacterium]|nr:SCP2 sterol-binding domain-containing protein [Burkholderiaceae bacterium]
MDDLKALLTGISTFMTGKLKVEGDMLLAQRLPTLFGAGKLG